MSAKQLVRLAAILGGPLLLWGAVALARRREATTAADGSGCRKLSGPRSTP